MAKKNYKFVCYISLFRFVKFFTQTLSISKKKCKPEVEQISKFFFRKQRWTRSLTLLLCNTFFFCCSGDSKLLTQKKKKKQNKHFGCKYFLSYTWMYALKLWCKLYRLLLFSFQCFVYVFCNASIRIFVLGAI